MENDLENFNMNRVLKWCSGDLSKNELKKYITLAFILFFIVGAYWIMRPLKDAIFANIVGITYQPLAKMLSLCFLVPLMLGYAKLVDVLEKDKLFYGITTAYIILFAIFDFLLLVPSIGMANTEPSPYRLLGWGCYAAIESFGSVMVAIFWSFVTSTTKSESAKHGFPLIIVIAQLGSILGPTLDTFATALGIPLLMGIAVIFMIFVQILMVLYVKKNSSMAPHTTQQVSKTGVFEGLRLILVEPYVLGILAVATLFDVVYTIMDYQMKVLGQAMYKTPEAFAEFLGHFGQSVNMLALVFALTGTGFLMRRVGLQFCLLFFPIAVAFVVAYVYVSPGLWQVFVGLVVIRGLAYGLNNPTKEIMYIPTSIDIQYKAKSWIDVFGSRGAKAAGSVINHGLTDSASALLLYGTAASFVVVSIWMIAAAYVGRTFTRLMCEEQVIGQKKR
jgi:ATP:ADP antiporter, AAA family